MKEESPLKLSALALLILVIGIMFSMVLVYAIVGVIQMVSFTIELISRGGYG